MDENINDLHRKVKLLNLIGIFLFAFTVIIFCKIIFASALVRGITALMYALDGSEPFWEYAVAACLVGFNCCWGIIPNFLVVLKYKNNKSLVQYYDTHYIENEFFKADKKKAESVKRMYITSLVLSVLLILLTVVVIAMMLLIGSDLGYVLLPFFGLFY